MGIKGNVLLMTCYVQVEAPDGSSVRARALLDSSSLHVSMKLAQILNLPRSSQNARISGVAGLMKNSLVQSLALLYLIPLGNILNCCDRSASCHMQSSTSTMQSLSISIGDDIQLADPNFGLPGRVDLFLV